MARTKNGALRVPHILCFLTTTTLTRIYLWICAYSLINHFQTMIVHVRNNIILSDVLLVYIGSGVGVGVHRRDATNKWLQIFLQWISLAASYIWFTFTYMLIRIYFHFIRTYLRFVVLFCFAGKHARINPMTTSFFLTYANNFHEWKGMSKLFNICLLYSIYTTTTTTNDVFTNCGLIFIVLYTHSEFERFFTNENWTRCRAACL